VRITLKTSILSVCLNAFISIGIATPAGAQTTAPNEWTWIGGSSTIGSSGGQPGVYGTLGSAAAANIPGSRDSATSWIDKGGHVWIYGGEGLDSQADYGQLDDLWEFDPTTQEWAWMGGGSSLPSACAASATNNGYCGWPALYGALGAFAPGISPGSRIAAMGWTDNDGNLWLFGGIGSVFWESDDFSFIDQYDLWEFNPSTKQWAWMSGNSTSICGESSSENWCGESGIYGTQGTPAIANIPPSRSNGTSWTDAKGNLWLFGGVQSVTTNIDGSVSSCNDMWVFESASNEWAWMNGASSEDIFVCDNTSGTYGVKGKPAATNTPSGRTGTASWIDSNGNLWAFGGLGGTTGISQAELNDLWIYEPAAPAPEPSFELVATPNPINIGATGPGTPTITTGTTTVNILVAGGFDSPVTLTATPDTCNGVTCITGSFSPATITGAGSSTLTISVTGAAVLIAEPIPLTITGTSGGNSQSIQVIVDVTEVGQLNAPTFSVPTGNYSTPQTVSISDSSGNQFIYYTTDGTTPTAASAVYVNPISVASTTTLKAFVMDVFNDQSPVSSATYSIVLATATPVFVPSGGTYSSAQSVSISDTTPGATIYYTTDGSAPTTNSTVYGGPITVSSTETLEAIASASGYALSAVASAVYAINLPTPSFSITGTVVSVAPGATTENTSTITLTPSGGFTGAISLSCAITPAAASDPATCNIPASVTISGSTAETTTLTVTTTAPSSALNRTRFFRPLVGGTGLACILLVGIPAGQRRWRWILGTLVLLLSLVGLGCGGSGNGGGGGNSGTTPGPYVITVTGTSGNITQVGTVSLTVQ